MKLRNDPLEDSQNQININDTIQAPTKVTKPKEKLQPIIKKLEVSGIKNASNLLQNSHSKLTGPPLSSGRDNYSAIRYRSYDTIRNNKEYDMFEETDETFCHDVRYICEKNKNFIFNVCSLCQNDLNQLDDFECDKIDFIARKHYKANRINETYRATKGQKQNSHEKCPCGCQKYRGKRIPFFTSLNELNFLGSGALLIFMFLKNYAVVMGLVLLIYGVFALTTNLMGGQNHFSEDCPDDWCRFTHNSANNNKIQPKAMMVIQWWLGVAFTVVWLMATKVIKIKGRNMNQAIDQKLKSASDRAVLIGNLPQGDFTQKELIEYFERLWIKMKKQKQATQNLLELKENKQSKKQLQFFQQEQGNNNKFNIESIQIIYSMKFARQINKKIIDLCRQINYILLTKPCRQNSSKTYRLVKDRKLYSRLKEELIEFIQIMGDLRKKFFAEENFRKSISAENCIVTFKTQQDRNRLLENFGQKKVGILTSTQQYVYKKIFSKAEGTSQLKGKYLRIERAPEPSDIQWKNCQLPESKWKTFGLYMLTIVIVLFSLAAVLGLDRLQDFVNQQEKAGNIESDSIILSITNIATSIFLQIVNKILWFSLAYMIEEEVNYTLSDKISSRMNKALFATSVNIIALPLITNYVFKVQVFGTKGLTGLVFGYQISTLFIGLPMKFFNPLELIKRLALYFRSIRNFIIRYFCLELNMVQENQEKGIKSINKFYEGDYFDVAQSYIYIMGTIYHALFFCQIEPAVLIPGTIIAIGFFFVLKAKLFVFCNTPEMLDLSIFETALSQVCLAPLIYGVGSVVMSYIENQIDPNHPFEYDQGLICIGLSLLFFFNPNDILNKMAMWGMECCSKIEIKKKKKKEDNGKVQNADTYYKLSNSLQLLGFEKVLKCESLDQETQKQLEVFCTQFIPKEKDRVPIKIKQKEETNQSVLQQQSEQC